MSDIFISHVEEDAEVALEIALGLEEAGYSTWCYELDGIPGPSYLLQTGQAVADSKAVVVVISPHSVGSRQVTREVVRAHESDKDFIPVRRDISHIEFQNRQPEWREAIGAATSIGIPKEGAASVLPRIIAGVKNLGIEPATKPDSVRIEQIRKALSELLVLSKIPELEHGPAEAAKGIGHLTDHVERPVKGLKRVINLRWFLIAGILLCLGFTIVLVGTAEYLTSTEAPPWYEDALLALLLLDLFVIAPGAYCLRRGIAQAHVSKLAQAKIPGRWWLLPIFLGPIGGMIAWLKQRDVDWRKASNLLTLGIVLSVFWAIPFLALQTPASSISPVEPEAEPQLIYEDNFSNTHSGWLQESLEDREFSYEDGEYHVLVKNSEWAVSTWNRNAGSFTDFTLEIDARPISGPEGSGYGVIFRAQTETDNYYSFLVGGNGYYFVGTLTDNVWTVLQDWTKSVYVKNGHDKNHLKVVVTGSKIEVYANEHYLTTVTDDSFAEGYVGVFVETSEPDAHVAFDNVKVYSLDLMPNENNPNGD